MQDTRHDYELWDLETGNWLESFESAQAAAEAIREYLVLNGDDYLEALGLGIRPGVYAAGVRQQESSLVGEELRAWLTTVDGPGEPGAGAALSAATVASFGQQGIGFVRWQGPEAWDRLERSLRMWAMLHYGQTQRHAPDAEDRSTQRDPMSVPRPRMSA